MEPNQLVQAPNKENIDEFSPGDTIKVDVRIIEGNRERVQSLEGVVIGEKGSGLQRTFTLRRTTRGFGVELIFPIQPISYNSLSDGGSKELILENESGIWF